MGFDDNKPVHYQTPNNVKIKAVQNKDTSKSIKNMYNNHVFVTESC